MTTIHIPGPYGGCDESAETDAFEGLCGGCAKAHQLHKLYASLGSYVGVERPAPSKADRFSISAKRAGYTTDQINALLHLQ